MRTPRRLTLRRARLHASRRAVGKTQERRRSTFRRWQRFRNGLPELAGKSRFHLRTFPPVGIDRLDQAALPAMRPTPNLGRAGERGRTRWHSLEPDQAKHGQVAIVGRTGSSGGFLDLPHHVRAQAAHADHIQAGALIREQIHHVRLGGHVRPADRLHARPAIGIVGVALRRVVRKRLIAASYSSLS